MQTRRQFLALCAAAGVMLTVNARALGKRGPLKAVRATAITQVSGDGVRLSAVAIEYGAPIQSALLSRDDFRVEGRTVTGVYTATSTNPGSRADVGRYVIVTLSPDDPDALLAQHKPGSSKSVPGKAGHIPSYNTTYAAAKATIAEANEGISITTSQVRNLIVEDFLQREFRDPKTGRSLRYNLFVPKGYDAKKSWPLVLFMHDAGATSNVTRTTLFQGLGAIAWASPEDQAKRPCFVLAPQFDEIIADDDSDTSSALDSTIDLITALTHEYSIDSKRLYVTGQSGGCMMSIAMDIKYPGFFAASFLVAGQWDPAQVKPLATQKLWIVVSEDDDKAFPGQNAIVDVLTAEGARVSRATWDGTWTAPQFRAAFDQIDAAHSPINYVTFAKGTVTARGQSGIGTSGHRNTWRIAYTIEPIREWLFRQHG
ncbi:putative peptidase [Luteibacter sp. Sphag1AF]|uniref:PHB depolymerase family esterase n=1 Tax=Luteibacter sp. Sphag1AF TaxID=2587031 RepID=UPI00161CE18E|nr:twin-arginine translocation signal domain-containing protein [Luteibacter sp. Sphag1AF]MBB3228635.1 putative peptidase [Luteibacter sp. Sphag1AF]